MQKRNARQRLAAIVVAAEAAKRPDARQRPRAIIIRAASAAMPRQIVRQRAATAVRLPGAGGFAQQKPADQQTKTARQLHGISFLFFDVSLRN